MIVVSGSRDWPADKLWFVTSVLIEHHQPLEVVRHGDAEDGVDAHVRRELARLRWPADPMPADWSVKPDTPPRRIRYRRDGTPYDMAAGHIRNDAMMDKGPRPRLLLAFLWHGSKGTGHAIRSAHRRGIPVEVFTEDSLRPDIGALDTDWEPVTLTPTPNRTASQRIEED